MRDRLVALDVTPLPWAASAGELIAVQEALGRSSPPLWRPEARPRSVGACFVCFQRGRTGPGAAGDPGWAAAVWMLDGALRDVVTVRGPAGAAYEPGLLALREGPLLEEAVRRLPAVPEVLIVNATGRDHPRRAGLALHLGARCDLPTIGVTTRPLVAEGPWPDPTTGATSPLKIAGDLTGCWVRTKAGAHPIAVHAAWRTDVLTAATVVLVLAEGTRTPEPLRHARRAAREARARNVAAGR
jgi:deoxyribonuclease V